MMDSAGLATRASFQIGKLTVNPTQAEVAGHSGRTHVEPRVMQVLIALYDAKGETLSRDRLIADCWGGRIVGDDALNRVILKIRKLATDWGEDSFSILTVPKIGYRLLLAEEVSGSMINAPEPTRLAVLPFRDLGVTDPSFTEGIAEEILTTLSRQPCFRVTGRTSSWMVRDLGAAEIFRRLGVAYILDGSVREVAGRYRITVALVDARTEFQVWSQDFDGELEDILDVQCGIARAVASSLRLRFSESDLPNSGGNGEAYQLYLAAKGLLRDRAPGRVASAIDLLRRATLIEPDFAPAWSRLALAIGMLAMTEMDMIQIQRKRSEALGHAKRALLLAPASAEAEAIYGALLYQDDIYAAHDHLERARVRGEDSSEFWFWLCGARDRIGDYAGAIAAARRAVQLDPLWYGAVFSGLTALDAGLEAEAQAWLNPILGHADHPFSAALVEANLALFRNDYVAALGHARRSLSSVDPDMAGFAAMTIARAFVGLGLPLEARRLVGFIVTEAEVQLRQGSLPENVLQRPFGGDRRNARINPERYFALRLLVRAGRSADVIQHYRSTTGSTAALRRHPDGLQAYFFDAAIVARALQDLGEMTEAESLLNAASSDAQESLAAGMAPRSHWLALSHLAAMEGRIDDAISALERIVAHGMSPLHPATMDDVCRDPCFDTLRDLRAFQLIEDTLTTRLSEQRRQVDAMDPG